MVALRYAPFSFKELEGIVIMSKKIIEGSNIFVTGGAGFVGSYVVEELLHMKT